MHKKRWLVELGMLSILLPCNPVTAQVAPDNTLPNNSRAVPNGNTMLIKGGTKAGQNLFHSFKQFAVTPGQTAYFDNVLEIQNVITRVTGGSISKIDGVIHVNGSANLFLLNPNGIIFGPNAALDLGGSFLGSTANYIRFADLTEYSAANPSAPPLLTVSAPIGLGFSGTPGPIQVQGEGHNLVATIFSPTTRVGRQTGLQVQAGKTLALVGGKLTLEGGTLSTEAGRIELGGVEEGLVNLNPKPSPSGWTLGYADTQSFKDIQLNSLASVEAGGLGGSGSIHLQGKEIGLDGGSTLVTQNQMIQSAGGIYINATELLMLKGTSEKLTASPFGETVTIPSSLLSDALGLKKGGNIEVSAPKIVIEGGAAINAKTFTSAPAGNISVKAPESIYITGYSPIARNVVSGIGAYTFGPNFANNVPAGSITVNTKQLTAENGGAIVSGTFNSGRGGDVTVNATQRVKLNGLAPLGSLSQLSATTFSKGDAGNLSVTAPQVELTNGGSLFSTTFAEGSSGLVKVDATKSLDIFTAIPNAAEIKLLGQLGLTAPLFVSISSAALKAPKSIQQTFNLPPVLSGESGDVVIKTPRLNIAGLGAVSVGNQGTGDAGELRIDAGSTVLSDRAEISASTAFGDGGNILLETGTLATLDNSRISADAQQGQGGQVSIKAQGVFLSPDSNLSASGGDPQFDGTVDINAPEIDFARAAATPDIDPKSPQVSSACQSGSGSSASSFTNIGAGGIPSGPSDPLTSNVLWEDKSTPQVSSNSLSTNQPVSPPPTDTYVEAQGWKSNGDGTVDFVTDATEPLDQTALAAASCK